MPVEIERKYLVAGEDWHQGQPGACILQAYIAHGTFGSVRVRQVDDKGFVTIKGTNPGLARPEFEYEIPREHAEAMIRGLCEHAPIEKTRYRIPHAGVTWEVDVFSGANRGLVIAELELTSVDQSIALPAWVGKEVTDDPRYRNSYLAEHPYADWPVKNMTPAV